MRTPRELAIALVLVGVLGGVSRGSEAWVQYEAKEYGFSMLIPAGTKLAEKEFGDGWGELWAEYEGVKLYGLAKMGAKATPEEIEKVGVKLTGIPSSSWKEIGKGASKGGWMWYRTVEASNGGKLLIGDYGVGSKASYLLILVTTESDFHENESDYTKWYQSIQLK